MAFDKGEATVTSTLRALAAAAFAGGFAFGAHAEPVRNIVLVHGAFAGGPGWHGAYEELTGRGYAVSIVQNPLTSFADDVAATQHVLNRQDRAVTLVGHSYGGGVITEAKVMGLVYVAAFAPNVGQSTLDQYAEVPRPPNLVPGGRMDFPSLSRSSSCEAFGPSGERTAMSRSDLKNGTVIWQRVEGALVFGAASTMFFLQDSGFVWWVTLAAFFAPDVSFAAYAFGSRIGAIGYNLLHIYGFGAVVLALGIAVDSVTFAQLGALWLAHSGLDRVLGYGLKSSSGFRFTHLGMIGQGHGR